MYLLYFGPYGHFSLIPAVRGLNVKLRGLLRRRGQQPSLSLSLGHFALVLGLGKSLVANRGIGLGI